MVKHFVPVRLRNINKEYRKALRVSEGREGEERDRKPGVKGGRAGNE